MREQDRRCRRPSPSLLRHLTAAKAENGQATAQHWASEREIKAVRETNDEVTRSAVEVGV
jgi:hypothetical protein